jgi:hypothetical protein
MNSSHDIENLQKALAALGSAIGKIISDRIEQFLKENQ